MINYSFAPFCLKNLNLKFPRVLQINIEIQQNTLISIGKDSKYIKGTTGKMVEPIIFRKYPERTVKREDIEKGSLNEKLLEQYLVLEKKRKIREGKQIIEEEIVKE